MDEGFPVLIILLIILLLLSAFFSSSEIVFSAVNRSKLKNLYESEVGKSESTSKLLENPDQVISTIQIGKCLTDTAAVSITAILFYNIYGIGGAVISAVIIAAVLIIFSEIFPDIPAGEYPEKFAVTVSPFINFLIILFKPVNLLLNLIKKNVRNAFRAENTEVISEEELINYVEEAKDVGGINANEEDMIKLVLEFDEMTAAEIITPRVDIVAISIDESEKEIDNIYYESGFSRLPVFETSIDNIVGVLLLKDYFYSKNVTHKKLTELIRPTIYVTKTIKLSELIRLLQNNHSYLAVVVDEFGGTIGIVTIEDIMEELIGDIWDEHDTIIKDIEKIGVNKYKVMGGTDIEDMFESIHVQCPENITSTTVNGWILENMDRLPEKGEHLNFDHYEIVIGKVDKNRIEYITIKIK